MHRNVQLNCWVLSLCLLGHVSYAQEVSPVDEIAGAVESERSAESEILALRESLIKAVAEKNADSLLLLVHDDFTLTAQNGLKLSVFRKHEGLREYFDGLFIGDEATIKSVRPNIVVDEILVLDGGATAVASGDSDDHYVMRSGGEYDLKTRWSATAVKVAGQWKLINLHISSDLFDNPIFNAAKSSLYRVGVIALMVGLIIGMLLSRLFGPRAA